MKTKLLFIDDEPCLLDVMKLLFTLEGYEVETALGGEAALAKLAIRRFDVVVSDYRMPKIDGLALLKTLREKKNFTPFIFLSGHIEPSVGQQMAGLGAFEVLHKDQLYELSKAIKRTLKSGQELSRVQESSTEETTDFMNILHSA